ncbi:MAG: hypothetical protein KAS32_25150 [Candidatus Peribacteraceae bacterium]|nr:hypothetical protein [Candidatus Peribacteraceae bacterium]
MSLGIGADEYWKCTVFEYNEMIRQYNKNEESRWRELQYNTWLSAAYQRMKKMPSLNKVLYGKDSPRYTDDDLKKAREFHQRMLKRGE